jgi:hypothetical protein
MNVLSNAHIASVHAELFGFSILYPLSNILGSSTGLSPA